jgi:hypothetical protein
MVLSRGTKDSERQAGRREKGVVIKKKGGNVDPFGSLAIPEGSMALRPTLAGGLPLSRMLRVLVLVQGPPHLLIREMPRAYVQTIKHPKINW